MKNVCTQGEKSNVYVTHADGFEMIPMSGKYLSEGQLGENATVLPLESDNFTVQDLKNMDLNKALRQNPHQKNNVIIPMDAFMRMLSMYYCGGGESLDLNDRFNNILNFD